MNTRDFEKFYSQNIDRIYRYVFFRVGENRDVCEDLVSEIFMKALKNFTKYDEKISKSAWIYQIAHNHLANHYRDQKKTVDLEEVTYSLKGSDGRDEFEITEKQLKLRAGLDKLKPSERELVTFKHLLGYTHAEIGEIQGKKASAVKMATHRALTKLKSHLTDA